MKKLVILCGFVILLSGCMKQNAFDKETDKVKAANAERLLDEEKQKEKWEEFYAPQSRPMDEVVGETSNETTKVNEAKLEEKDSYSDPEQFAVFVSDNLYRFMKGESKPEEYLAFLVNHGSKLYKKKHLVEDKKKDIRSLTLIQKAVAEESIKMLSYRVSAIKKEEFNSDIASFYREVTLEGGEKAYYSTSIIEEGGTWKFDDDRLSGPVNFELLEERSEKQ